MFGYITGGTELNLIRPSVPTLGAQQQTTTRGQSPDGPVSSRGVIHGQGSHNRGHLNAIIPVSYSINALPTVQI